MTNDTLNQVAVRAIEAVGIEGAELVRETLDPGSFGDGEVVFRVGPLLLRFIRDRGQDFMDLGSTMDPERFHQFDDVEIAMSWRSVEVVLGKSEPGTTGGCPCSHTSSTRRVASSDVRKSGALHTGADRASR